jgi:hypothetical protein
MTFERGVNCCVDIGVESPPNLGLDTWRCLDANPDVSQRYSVARPVASRPVGLRGRGHNRIPPTCWNPVRTSTGSAIPARRCSLLIWCFIPSQSHPGAAIVISTLIWARHFTTVQTTARIAPARRIRLIRRARVGPMFRRLCNERHDVLPGTVTSSSGSTPRAVVAVPGITRVLCL